MPATILPNTPSPSSRPDLPATGFIRERRLLEYVPFSHATLWRRVNEKPFPRR
jgi:predicted DNA-binding transcriptional regulator AlpA